MSLWKNVLQVYKQKLITLKMEKDNNFLRKKFMILLDRL